MFVVDRLTTTGGSVTRPDNELWLVNELPILGLETWRQVFVSRLMYFAVSCVQLDVSTIWGKKFSHPIHFDETALARRRSL